MRLTEESSVSHTGRDTFEACAAPAADSPAALPGNRRLELYNEVRPPRVPAAGEPEPCGAASGGAACGHRAGAERSDVRRRCPPLHLRLPRPRYLRGLRATGEPAQDDAAYGGAFGYQAVVVRCDVRRRCPPLHLRLPRPRYLRGLRATGEPAQDDAAYGGAAPGQPARGAGRDVRHRCPPLHLRLPRPRYLRGLRATGEPAQDDAAYGGAAPGHRAAFSVLPGLHLQYPQYLQYLQFRVRPQLIQIPSFLLQYHVNRFVVDRIVHYFRLPTLLDG